MEDRRSGGTPSGVHGAFCTRAGARQPRRQCHLLAGPKQGSRQWGTIRAPIKPRQRIRHHRLGRWTGVPEEDRAKIFEPYFSRKPNGIGLGLYIARLVIEPYGKLVYDETGPFGGASFEAEFDHGVGL